MLQAAAGPVMKELIDKERALLILLELIEQSVALPHSPADRHFTKHCRKDQFLFEMNLCVLFQDVRQGSPSLEAHLKTRVLESEPEPLDSSLRRTGAEHSGNTTANRKILLRTD